MSRDSAATEQRDVLISRFSALGDVAMTLAPIYDACLSEPGRRFILLTRKHPATIFINRPPNLILHSVNTDDYKGPQGIYRLCRELRRRYNIGVYVDLHDVLRTQLLRLFFRMRGVKVVKVRKNRSGRRRLTRRNRKYLVAQRPMGLRYADALEAGGVAGKNKFRSLFPSLPDAGVFAGVSEPKQGGEYWIGIAPFARHEGKIYPAPLMEKVILSLMEHEGVKLFIFGFGEKETGVIEGWRARAMEIYPEAGARIVNMAAAAIGIPAELALIAHCDVMLSMDSANMHLAVLAGTRVVSVWGATHPYCGFKPLGVKDEDIIQLDMTCRPCSVFGDRKCRRGDYHCLHGITPRRIVDTLIGSRSR